MRAPGAAAAPTLDLDEGSSTWVYPDGRTKIFAGHYAAADFEISLSFPAVAAAPAGGSAWHLWCFDISDAGRGGTLRYVDGDGTTYQWKMPTTSTGPQLARITSELTT